MFIPCLPSKAKPKLFVNDDSLLFDCSLLLENFGLEFSS